MTLFRIASREYPPDNSQGAKLYGGRWNKPGTPVLYAAGSRALAAVEVIAHHGAIPHAYQIIEIEVPDDISVRVIERHHLPNGWPEQEADEAAIGTQWSNEMETAVLKVPSAVFPNEWNYIINPRHPDFMRIRFTVTGEQIDRRLRRS